MLVSFQQAGVDNVELNRPLAFDFSEDVQASSISAAAIQVREGAAFGRTIPGAFEVQGARVVFRPQLPGLCDLSDAGLQPGTTYRVQILGWPEEAAIRNTRGQRLRQTSTWEFRTRVDGDPQKFRDAIPAAAPLVTSSFPANGAAAAAAGTPGDRQRVELTMSENVRPCSVNATTVTIQVYEVGSAAMVPTPEGRNSGFVTGGADTSDQAPGDVTTWGSTTGSAWPGGPQSLPASIHLLQDFDQTRIIVSPLFGQDPNRPELGGVFPDNVLIVVRLSFGIEDFAGTPLTPFSMSFTTENQPATPGAYMLRAEGETPFLDNTTTAEVNTPRAQSRVQGFLLFAGDGDNGSTLTTPSLPNTSGSGCTAPFQLNDGAKDAFDPDADIVLDAGPINTCVNATDGSTAVIWEFASLRIRSGVTVRMTGANPSILLVDGDVIIEGGATLLARGDGAGGTPNANGGNGNTNQNAPRLGGRGVLGGGNGADAKRVNTGDANPGLTGVGSPDGRDDAGGHGTGHGGRNARKTAFATGGGAAGAGGAGHSTAGQMGIESPLGPSMSYINSGTRLGGAVYPQGAGANLLLVPSAGSGGAAGGYSTATFTTGQVTGGAGGAGGGFIDITSSGDIQIFGTLSAAGGRGGDGNTQGFVTSGAGGGGSGGGIRLLTPNDINLNGGTVTAAGGAGGNAVQPPQGGTFGGAGGAGGVGRLVMEDGDSVISGFGAAIVVPTEGDDGFFRGTFDATRFQGGGLSPVAETDLIFMGPLSPSFLDPLQADFEAGVPTSSSPGVGSTVMTVEVQGFDLAGDGSADLGSATGYVTVGTFEDSGNEAAPTWVSTGALAGLSGKPFLQIRITMTLNPAIGPFDPGPFIDTWHIRFNADN